MINEIKILNTQIDNLLDDQRNLRCTLASVLRDNEALSKYIDNQPSLEEHRNTVIEECTSLCDQLYSSIARTVPDHHKGQISKTVKEISNMLREHKS